MSSTNDNLVNEFVGKIQQFLSHQMENNATLSEAAKESLTVSLECIEQAYSIQPRRPASNELFDLYKASKQQPPQADQAQAIPGLNLGPNPARFIQDLAMNILSQATAGASATAPPNPNVSASGGAPTAPGTTAAAPAPPPAPSAPPKVRKRATEAEILAADSFKNQGNDLMKQDKYREAFDCYTQAINIDDNNAIYYSNRAAASSKLGDHQAALQDCMEAVEIDSTYSKAYGRMGLAYASLEDHRRAKEAYLKAVELNPTNESYKNNLRIAEEKLSETANANANAPSGIQGDMMSMLRSMMSNPEVRQMAMRSLQDPRMQSLFGLGGGGGGGGAAGGATGGSGAQQD